MEKELFLFWILLIKLPRDIEVNFVDFLAAVTMSIIRIQYLSRSQKEWSWIKIRWWIFKTE